MYIAPLFFANPFLIIKNRDIPISVNRVVQTGANSQLGGVKNGFSNVAYHDGMAALVNIEPRIPASWHTAIHAKSNSHLFMLLFQMVSLLAFSLRLKSLFSKENYVKRKGIKKIRGTPQAAS